MRAVLLDLLQLFLRGTALMLAVVAAAAALMGLGGLFSDSLDVLNQAALLWFGLGVCAVALAGAACRGAQRRTIQAIAVAAIAASSLRIAPELLDGAVASLTRGHGQSIKIVQYNLWESNKDPETTARWLLKQNADVVLVEEAGGLAEPVLRALHRHYTYRVSCRRDVWCDTWVFSRWPMSARRGFYKDGRDLSAAWATIDHPSGAFTVAATHFAWPIPAGRWQEQSRILVAGLAGLPRENLIVGGDFNSAPWSFGLSRQDKALDLKRLTHGLPTWPSGGATRLLSASPPLLAIDQVYAGKAWKAVRVERGPNLGSDHRAVVVTLARVSR